MIRKWLVLLLAAVLLLGCVCPAQATSLLTQRERYDSALQELRKYLNGESAMPLDSVWGMIPSRRANGLSASRPATGRSITSAGFRNNDPLHSSAVRHDIRPGGACMRLRSLQSRCLTVL